MHPNALFAERFNVVPAVPVDASGSGGLVLPAINLRDAVRATLMVIKAAGTAGDDPTITVTQGDGITNAALDNGKALTAITRAHTKRHASAIPKTYTTETQSAANTFTSTTLAEEKGVILIDFTPDMLDVDNGFFAIAASIADVGTNAQLIAGAWIIESKMNPPLNAEANA